MSTAARAVGRKGSAGNGEEGVGVGDRRKEASWSWRWARTAPRVGSALMCSVMMERTVIWWSGMRRPLIASAERS